ncbi:MAG: reverse transcriptase domain-containing protein, partial [Aeromonas sp.]
MGFKRLNKNIPERAGTSNPGRQYPDDEISKIRNVNQLKTIQKNKMDMAENESNVSRNNFIFKRGVEERIIRRELFLYEYDERFEERSLKIKMIEIIKRSSEELKEVFYQLGIDDNIPSSWENFKSFIIDFCLEQSINIVRKYNDERWSEYCLRLKQLAIQKNWTEKEVLRKIRGEKLPLNLQVIFYSVGVTLDLALERIKECERYNSCYKVRTEIKQSNMNKDNIYDQKRNDEQKKCFKCHKIGHVQQNCIVKNDKLKIKCYNCGKEGHLSYNCGENKQNNSLIKKLNGLVDERYAKMNGRDVKVIFDTGATDNMITSGALSELGSVKIAPKAQKYFFFDGSSCDSIGEAKIEFEYNDMKSIQTFNVVKNDENNKILLSNIQTKKHNLREIPIQCSMNTEHHSPVSWNRPIRSFSDKIEFEKLVTELEEKGVVEESNSKWLNPVVLIRKKNGELRFCVDFRRLNDLVAQDHFEIPRINDFFHILRDMKYFTLIDLKDGFYHIDIEENDKEKTSFYTGKRLMQFRKMPQGFKNSPAIFQRAMNQMFKDVIGEKCVVYIDDILVFGRNEAQHDDNLKRIMEIMKSYGLNENKSKRIEKVKKVKFLGYEIEENTIKPCVDRAQGIINFTKPKNRRGLQRFLGCINYDRMFIKNITSQTRPLYKILERDKFEWHEDEIQAFEKLKENWKKELYLRIPDMNIRFELETDASNVGIGGVLMQDSLPIAYISRSLTKAEQKYSITEKEVLAALWSMEKLRYYLTGRIFDLITDHKAMIELKKKLEFGSNRIYRWFQRLENFQFVVKYREGVKMVASDALSRTFNVDIEEGEENKNVDRDIPDENKILKMHVELNHRKNIYRNVYEKGFEATKSQIRRILKKCEVCLKKDKQYKKTCYYVDVEKPGDKLGIDILEIKHHDKILVAIDYFSRKIFAQSIKTKEAKKTVKFLNTISKEFQFRKILTDNGREFNNNSVKKWCEEKNIKQTFSIPYYHQSNGRIERAIRTIRDACRKIPGATSDKLGKIISAYNRTEHRGIGMTPEQALKKENWDKVKINVEKYKGEFECKSKRVNILRDGEKVLIRNELRKGKMDDAYNEHGIVVRRIHGNVYEISKRRK